LIINPSRIGLAVVYLGHKFASEIGNPISGNVGKFVLAGILLGDGILSLLLLSSLRTPFTLMPSYQF